MNESHKYKLVFFHLPKNAGVSVRRAIGIDRKSHKFPFTNVSVALAIDVKANTLDSIYESYHKFAIVRNPYERMVSLYNFRKQGNDLYDYANLKESDFKSKEELQNSPNIEYWKKLQDIYNTGDIFAILKQRCGNCAAFNITDKMRDCIKKGIGDEAPAEPIIKVGEIGYCRFLKFKCAAARTCQAWVSGGPIKD